MGTRQPAMNEQYNKDICIMSRVCFTHACPTLVTSHNKMTITFNATDDSPRGMTSDNNKGQRPQRGIKILNSYLLMKMFH